MAMFRCEGSGGLVPVISSEIAVYFKSYPAPRTAQWEEMRKMALPQPQINKDNGGRQMDGKFLPSLQSDPWDTYLHVQFPAKQWF